MITLHSPSLPKNPPVVSIAESYIQPFTIIQHRTFYDRRCLQHDANGAAFVDVVPCLLIQLAPHHTSLVEQFFPADCLGPAQQKCFVQSRFFEVVEVVVDTLVIQPLAGFFSWYRSWECRRSSSSVFVKYRDWDPGLYTQNPVVVIRLQISLNSSLMLVLERVFSSTCLTITAQ